MSDTNNRDSHARSAERLRQLLGKTEWVLLFARAVCNDDPKTKREITEILDEIREERESQPDT